ncbi:MAG TPA: hypothetical protein V6D10_15980 [Trichocoleus sp.]
MSNATRCAVCSVDPFNPFYLACSAGYQMSRRQNLTNPQTFAKP